MKEINEYIKEWSQKLSIPEKDIEKELKHYIDDETEIHSDLTDEDKKTRALQRLALSYKKQLKSPAVGFEGVIIGIGDCIDIVAKQKREALEKFRENPQQAISDGVVDEEGMPLDTRKEWSQGRKNPSYGKPLPEHNYLRNVFGVAVKVKIPNDTPKFFSMNLSGDKAQNENIPLFKMVRFMAIDKTAKESADKAYVLNASTFTNISVDEELQLPNIEGVVKTTPHFAEIKDLVNYHNSTKDIFNRVVITEGAVSNLNLQPTAFGSRIMTIEDENLTLDDIEANTGVTCWLPLRVNIDFAEGSKVIVVGRTAQGKKKDETGNITDELGDVTINAFGVYAIPEFKIELPEVEALTEENI